MTNRVWKILLKIHTARQVHSAFPLKFIGTEAEAESLIKDFAKAMAKTEDGVGQVIAVNSSLKDKEPKVTLSATINANKKVLVLRKQDGISHSLVRDLRKESSEGDS